MVVVSSAPDLMNSELERLNRRVLELEAGGESLERESVESRASSLDLESLSLEPTVSDEDGTLESIPSIMESSEARAVRVRTEVLDELVSYAGEVSILRARLQQQIATVKTNLGELGETVRVFRDQLRDLEIESEAQMLSTNERIREEGGLSEFDPLELDRFSRLQTLSRQLGESLGSLVAVQAGISEFAGMPITPCSSSAT
jgi:chemotaxis protein histidine kinase CheA